MSENDAKQAASAMVGMDGATEQTTSQPMNEIPVAIRARVIIGPFFIGLIASIILMIVTIFVNDPFLQLVDGVAVAILVLTLLSKMVSDVIKGGPASGWFKPGTVKAWLSLDQDELVIRTLYLKQGFRPLHIEWLDSLRLLVGAEESSFELVFESGNDAAKVASMIKNSFPNVREEVLGMEENPSL